jgi:hypothetical protein
VTVEVGGRRLVGNLESFARRVIQTHTRLDLSVICHPRQEDINCQTTEANVSVRFFVAFINSLCPQVGMMEEDECMFQKWSWWFMEELSYLEPEVVSFGLSV